MERYESYKDSGVKWLGEIPGHWEMYKLKYLFKLNRLKNVGNKCNTILSLSYGKIIIKKDLNEGLSPESYESYQLLNGGDIVIRSTDLQNDHTSLRTGLVKNDGAITSAYIGLKNQNTNIYDSRYYHYFLHDWDITKAIYNEGKGLRQSLNWDDIKNMLLPVLDIKEQTAIANYLDSVTSKIDEAISQQQKMIDLLNERKQIIIQNAVTKGLDPNAKMKDSGVEWIGEIPEDWEISLIGHLFNIKAGGDAKPKLYSMTKDEIHKYPVYTNCNDSNNVYAYTSIPYFEANTITVTGRGDIGNAFFRKTPYDAIIRLLSLKPRIEMDCRFFTFFIDKVIPFTSDSAAVAQLSAVQLKNFVCCVPSKREQSDIADYLDDITSKIDSSISQCNKMISLLQERKQIIINDVVTGKVKVI